MHQELDDFEPSTKMLKRISNLLLERGHIAKTSLSLNANINYARLSMALIWLKNRGLIEDRVKDDGIDVRLTASGREFAMLLLGNDNLTS